MVRIIEPLYLAISWSFIHKI